LGLSVINDKRNKKQLVSQSITSMISELKEIKKAIEENKKPVLQVDKHDLSSVNLNFSFGGFITASYESMLFSGVLREIDIETQRKIIDLYEHIRLYNDMKRRLQEIIVASVNTVSPIFVENLQKFGETLSGALTKIKTKVDDMLQLLTNNYET